MPCQVRIRPARSGAASRACLPTLMGWVRDALTVSRRAVLTDQQWARIASLLPSSVGRPGRRFRDDRRVDEGIIYRFRCGLAWRDVPVEFGPWQTLWKRYRRYSGDGTWNKVLTEHRLLSAGTRVPGTRVEIRDPDTARRCRLA
jgi:transposase